MPISMNLRENDRVLYYEVTDPWTFSQLKTAFLQNRAIRDEHPHKIHVIANLLGTRQLPKDIISARTFSPDTTHTRAGYVFFVGPSNFVRSIIEMTTRLLRSDKLQIVSTEDEAWSAVRAIIKNEDGNEP